MGPNDLNGEQFNRRRGTEFRPLQPFTPRSLDDSPVGNEWN
jgi:hypothetical protein